MPSGLIYSQSQLCQPWWGSGSSPPWVYALLKGHTGHRWSITVSTGPLTAQNALRLLIVSLSHRVPIPFSFWLTKAPPTLLGTDPSEPPHTCFHSQVMLGIFKVRPSISFPKESSTVSWKSSSWLGRGLLSFKESRLFHHWPILDYEGNVRVTDSCVSLLEKPKWPQAVWFEQQKIYFLTLLEARSPRWRCLHIWFLLRFLSLACRWPPSRCVLSMYVHTWHPFISL